MSGGAEVGGETPTLFHDLGRLLDAAPLDLGVTGWIEVDPDAVRAFRRATWSDGPGAGDSVPPLMLLSLTNRLLPDLMQVPGASSGVNYGADAVRFGPDARPGDRIRVGARLTAAVPAGAGVQTTVEVRVEVEGGSDPACVVQSLSRWMP